MADELTPSQIVQEIKKASDFEDRTEKDTGAVISWEGLQAALDTPDTRPAPTRTGTRVNPDRQMGVILQVEGSKEQFYAPLYEPDPNAYQEAKRVSVRKMGSFGEPEVHQLVQHRLIQSKKMLFLYLTPKIADAYQLQGGPLGTSVLIIAPRYLAWEKGKYAFILDELEAEEGYPLGEMPQFSAIVSRFITKIHQMGDMPQ